VRAVSGTARDRHVGARWGVPAIPRHFASRQILVGENKRRFSARSVAGMQMVAFALWAIGGDFSDFWRSGVDPVAIAAGVLGDC
jgi:hypothetical protein